MVKEEAMGKVAKAERRSQLDTQVHKANDYRQYQWW